MPNFALPAPIWVETQAAFNTMVADLAQQPALGVDTESNSLFAYRERVCVIQISTPARDYVVDTLADLEVRALGPLFANPAQQKIFHAAEYDLICLKRDYGFTCANLFDTMIAARTLGKPQVGLAALLETRFGLTLNKRYQRANWGARPLEAGQLDYARLDSHYLIELRDWLLTELRAAGCEEEAREEFTRLGCVPASNGPAPNASAHGFWRVNGARDLTPHKTGILREVYAYRERQAERQDVPPFKVMNDQTLLAIAQTSPRSLDDLRQLHGMTPGQIHRHGAHLLHAVQRGLRATPPTPPPFEREADEVRERYDRLRQWRKQRAQARGVESDVIVPREALWELARRAPKTLDDLQHMAHLGPWRRQTYGPELLRVLHG